MSKKTKYYNHNSTLLDPVPVRDYVSSDGHWVVMPFASNKKWVCIHDGEFIATGSSFEICMRKMKRIKTKEELSQGASNALADMLQ